MPSSSSKMVGRPAASGLDTSIYDITLSLTVQIVGKSRSCTAPPRRWLEIISHNHFKVDSSPNSATASSIPKMILRPYLSRIAGLCWDETTRAQLDSRMGSRRRQHNTTKPKARKCHIMRTNRMSMQSWCQCHNLLGDGT